MAKKDKLKGYSLKYVSSTAIRSFGLMGVLASCGLLASCAREGVLDPQGPISSAEKLLLINATEIMLVVVLPVIVLALAFAWWFRASNTKATYLPDWEYSGRIELVVWSIPAMIVILLAGVGWISSHQLDPRAPIESKNPPLRVQVVALDWKWLFIYPEQKIATINELTVPAGTPVNFELTSATVMNAFFVPQLGSQIYAMPGMTTHLNLLASRPGAYPGIASHFSGDGFSRMTFVLHAVPAEDFQTWAGKAGDGKPDFDGNAYNLVVQPGHADTAAWRGVAPDLFDTILKQSAPGSTMTGGM